MRFVRSTFSLSYETFGVSSPFDPTFHYVSSPVFPPAVLGALRLLFALYTLTTAIIVLVWYSTVAHDGSSYFAYFTNLTWIGITAYFWASSVQTIAFVLRGRKSYPLQTWPRFLQLLHVVLYSTIIVLPIIVTVAFWSLLASPSTLATVYEAWSNISRHAFNTVFALFEIFLTHGGPSPWCHLVVLLLILICYVGVVYITHATQGFYTYSFLDPSKEHGYVVAYIVGILVGCCIVFSIVKGICWVRWRLSVRYRRFEERSPGAEDLEEWQGIGEPKDPPVSRGMMYLPVPPA